MYLKAMSRPKLKVAVGLLTGHKTVRALLFILGPTKLQYCDCVGRRRGYCAYCVSAFGTGMQIYKTLDLMFLKHEDLEHTRVNGLIKLGANGLA
jgi:hypothetical protein